MNTPDEAYELAKDVQDGFGRDEFLATFQEIAEALDDDLSDEALAAAAGGTDEEPGTEPGPGIVRPAEVVPASLSCRLSGGGEGKATAKFREIYHRKPGDQ